MRKDVKLGFAVGGVLLAVLIVYVSVVGRPHNQPGASASAGGNGSGQPVNSNRDITPDAPGISDPFTNNHPSNPAPAAGTESAGGNSPGVNWDKLLAAGPVTTVTPVPENNSPTPTFDPNRGLLAGADIKTGSPIPTFDPGPQPSPNSVTRVNIGPATRPNDATATGMRIHIVASGETLTTISNAAYGSPNFYPAILKANPGITPNRLKIGQKINLPDLSIVQPTDKSTKSSDNKAEITLTSTEYRVVSGDSLYKISTKLYGKGDRADKIYELNKSIIGEDKAKLKLGMVLKLPEAPTK